MKRTIYIVLSVFLLVIALGGIAVPSQAAGTPTLSFNSAEAEPGETVTLQLRVDNNIGIAGLAVSLDYDTDVLKLTKVTQSSLFSGFTSGRNYVWDESTNVTKNGILATFEFTVSQETVAGTYPVNILVRDCVNAELEDVACNVSSGAVTVVGTEPSTPPTIVLRYPTVSFEDVIVMNVYYSASHLEDVEEMGLITYNANVATPSVDTADHVVPGYAYSESDKFYFSSTSGIAPKNLSDTIYFAVYYKLVDGTYGYTKVFSYSPKTYAYNQLKSGSAEMKPLVVAMLNYGAAAQSYFNYKTDALMNAELTEEQKALVEDYRGDMIASVTSVSGAKLGEFINDGSYTKRYPTISFEGAFCINYYFKPSERVDGDVMMYIWSLEDFNNASVLTRSNATRAVEMKLTENGEYLGVLDGIAAKNLDKAAYVTFVYSDGTTNHCGGVIGYSIGMYCKNQASKTGLLAELAKNCAVYGYYAKELFYK